MNILRHVREPIGVSGGVELMQVGTVRMAQHRVALKDLCTRETMMTRHSYSLTVAMPIFAAV